MNDCIEACNDTHEAALRTLAWVTSEGFQAATPEFIRLLCDCAEVTQTAANFMLRGSELHPNTCKACEEVCEAVYDACEQSGLDEIEDFKQQVKACADHCRETANVGGSEASGGNVGQRTGRGGREESVRARRAEKTTEGVHTRGRTPGKEAR